MATSKNQKNKEESPKWLQKLQLNSWEPEILLSGIVLYGMFKMPDILDSLHAFVQVNVGGLVNDINNFISIMKVAIYWLISGLILHLISRGIWVGMIGLSFTFHQGIKHEKLRLSPKFKDSIESIPSFQHIIISLEKISSSLFAVSFMLFMSMIGAYFFFFALLIVPIVGFVYGFAHGDYTTLTSPFWNVFTFTVLIIGFIALIDFLSLGWLKRFKWLSSIYYPMYRIISFVTLSRFYRPIYYAIISNLSKWKISLILLFFVIISVYAIDKADSDYPGENFSGIDMWSDRIGDGAYHGYYDDQIQGEFSNRAQIQSDIISGNTLRLFVVLRADNEDAIRKNCSYDSLIQRLDTARRHVDLHCLTVYNKVFLDDSLLQGLNWKFHYKVSTRQKGLLTWINIRELPEGQHELLLKHPKEKGDWLVASIPFFREYPIVQNIPEKSARDPEEADYMALKPLLSK